MSVPVPSDRPLAGQRVLMFTGDIYEDLELWYPKLRLQEAGATPMQELAFALANAIAVLDAVKARGQVPEADFPQVVGRISFFVNAGIRFVTEICKMRAFCESARLPLPPGAEMRSVDAGGVPRPLAVLPKHVGTPDPSRAQAKSSPVATAVKVPAVVARTT